MKYFFSKELSNWSGAISLNQYEINQDTDPEIIYKKPSQELEYIQELAVRYLKPPTPAPPGDIIIQQEANLAAPPAPPIVIRQAPPPPEEKPTIIIREAPPPPPPRVPVRTIVIPGKRLPPPPRKVVLEKFAPLPPKPQSILVERWLPYIPQKRKVIYQAPPPDPVLAKPRNVIISWEAPRTVVKKQVKYLGVINADPAHYVSKYGASIRQSNQLPDIVNEIKTPEHLLLAANVEYSGLHELTGDIDALKLVDLDREGLGEYKQYLDTFNSSSRVQSSTGTPVAFNSQSVSTVASDSLASGSVIASDNLVTAPIAASATLPYRSITALSSLPKLDELGFPRANSTVYGSAITTVNNSGSAIASESAVISGSVANASEAVASTSSKPAMLSSASATGVNASGIGLDFSPSSRAVSPKSANPSGFILRSRSESIFSN